MRPSERCEILPSRGVEGCDARNDEGTGVRGEIQLRLSDRLAQVHFENSAEHSARGTAALCLKGNDRKSKSTAIRRKHLNEELSQFSDAKSQTAKCAHTRIHRFVRLGDELLKCSRPERCRIDSRHSDRCHGRSHPRASIHVVSPGLAFGIHTKSTTPASTGTVSLHRHLRGDNYRAWNEDFEDLDRTVSRSKCGCQRVAVRWCRHAAG